MGTFYMPGKSGLQKQKKMYKLLVIGNPWDLGIQIKLTLLILQSGKKGEKKNQKQMGGDNLKTTIKEESSNP